MINFSTNTYSMRITYIFFALVLVTLSFSCGGGDDNIAIDKAKFGITRKEFYQLFPASHVELNGNKYKLYPYFNKSDELNMVYLMDTSTKMNKKLDTALFDKMDSLQRYFTEIYGAPTSDRGYPKMEEMINGKSFDCYVWEIGKKKIMVGIGLEATKEANYYYVVSRVALKKITP